MTTWISCRKQLPQEDEDNTQYLLLLHNGRCAVAFVSYPFANETLPQWYGEEDAEFDAKDVTHWANLPRRPGEILKGLPPSLNALKMEAKALKKASGQSHTDCLESVARQYSFTNYPEAVEFYAKQ